MDLIVSPSISGTENKCFEDSDTQHKVTPGVLVFLEGTCLGGGRELRTLYFQPHRNSPPETSCQERSAFTLPGTARASDWLVRTSSTTCMQRYFISPKIFSKVPAPLLNADWGVVIINSPNLPATVVLGPGFEHGSAAQVILSWISRTFPLSLENVGLR